MTTSDPFAQTDLSTDAPAAPQAPRRNVTHLGRPSDIGASVLGHLIDTAARGMPGEWTARWTPGEVRLASAADPRVHILLAPKGTSADVRLRVMQGAAPGEAHFHLARALRDALALHERVNAESVEAARAAGVPAAKLLPAPLPAPAHGTVRHTAHAPIVAETRALIDQVVARFGGCWVANHDARGAFITRADTWRMTREQANDGTMVVVPHGGAPRLSRAANYDFPPHESYPALCAALVDACAAGRQEAA